MAFETLNEKTKQLISEIAENLAYQIKPNNNRNIKEVVKNIGGKITYTNDLFEVSNGTIKKITNNKFEILIYNNNNLTIEIENFILAHELGHLFLHLGFAIEKWEKINVGKINPNWQYEEELEANQFAFAFLMPKKEYRKVLFENKSNDNIINISLISKYFNVTEEKARIRGYELNFLKHRKELI